MNTNGSYPRRQVSGIHPVENKDLHGNLNPCLLKGATPPNNHHKRDAATPDFAHSDLVLPFCGSHQLHLNYFSDSCFFWFLLWFRFATGQLSKPPFFQRILLFEGFTCPADKKNMFSKTLPCFWKGFQGWI